jgi:HAD superfamily hydrolase (TIGR01549 family)
MGWAREWWEPRLMAFYAGPYRALQNITIPRPEARPLVEWALGEGYEVAIVTAPLFPRSALEERMRWAGLAGLPVALVTDAHTSHFAKPQPEYYAEALARLGRRPEQGLVVGDDWENDMVAATAAGLRTYWITPAGGATPATPPAGGLDWVSPQPVGQGTLADFAVWAPANLPALAPGTAPAGRALPFLLTGNLAALHGSLDGLGAAAWRARPAAAEWSLTEIVCHLRDVEREVHLPRLRAVVENDNPFVAGADTDPWAVERDYQSQSGPEALRDFSAARKEAAHYLRAQPEAAWNRTARHAIFGPTLLSEIVGWVLDHDRIHLEQVRKTRN